MVVNLLSWRKKILPKNNAMIAKKNICMLLKFEVT